jgi:hypothetical protein
LRFVG